MTQNVHRLVRHIMPNDYIDTDITEDKKKHTFL